MIDIIILVIGLLLLVMLWKISYVLTKLENEVIGAVSDIDKVMTNINAARKEVYNVMQSIKILNDTNKHTALHIRKTKLSLDAIHGKLNFKSPEKKLKSATKEPITK